MRCFIRTSGVSLSLFFLVLIAAVTALNLQAARRPRAPLLMSFAILAALPFAEPENILWVPFAFGAVSLYAIELAGKLGRFEDWLAVVARFAALSPVRALADGIQLLAEAAAGGRVLRMALVWVVPVLFAASFAFLFVVANPVLENAVPASAARSLERWSISGSPRMSGW